MKKEDLNNGVQDKFMSSVKVGAKGQIVIPKEVREMFNIEPGGTLLLLADRERGIAVHKLDFFDNIANQIFSGQYKPQEGEKPEQLSQFAKEVKKVGKMEDEGKRLQYKPQTLKKGTRILLR